MSEKSKACIAITLTPKQIQASNVHIVTTRKIEASIANEVTAKLLSTFA